LLTLRHIVQPCREAEVLEKCTTCKSRILAGGRSFLKWKFCSKKCETTFKAALAEQLLSAEEIEQHIGQVFASNCPLCKRPGTNDIYSSTTVTGLLFAHRTATAKHLCCARCARKKRLIAALHCLTFGWWSPHAAIVNVFVLPSNLIACLFVKKPTAPSPLLASFVKVKLAETVAPQCQAAAASARQDEASDSAEPPRDESF
jgi:hypothetical protein